VYEDDMDHKDEKMWEVWKAILLIKYTTPYNRGKSTEVA